MSKIGFIVNKKSGTGLGSNRLETLAKKLNIGPYEIRNIEKDIRKLVKNMANTGCTTIVACGGDGTISCIADAIVGQKLHVKFAVIPLGTFNHFARDIGMPLDVTQCLEIIEQAHSKHIDVVEVNGKYFINNSSLGYYSDFVANRKSRQKRGFRKWPAFVASLIDVLKRHPFVSIEFATQGKRIKRKTPFVFIGNNKYNLQGLRIGSRERLDQGILTVCIGGRVGRWGMFRLAWRAFRGKLIEDRDFQVIGLQECSIRSHKSLITVSYDGEVQDLPTPLVYRIVPKALHVIIPK